MTSSPGRGAQIRAQAKARAKGGNGAVAAFAVVVGGAFFSIPFIANYTKEGNYTQQKEALNATQIRRGPYANTGSKDVGVDPDWDFRTGMWHGRRAGDAPKPAHRSE